jgi:formyltetrahydrofolate-dependent phosphoribosylglycinamide formyltransferase
LLHKKGFQFRLIYLPENNHMFNKLLQKWKVSPLQLVLILCTFAIGGSLTGLAARKIIGWWEIEHQLLWIMIYLMLVTLLWPVAVMTVSVPFGQYGFFSRYLVKMAGRMGVHTPAPAIENHEVPVNQSFHPPVSIAIFASGAGSNAQKIIDHFRHSSIINVALIICNKPTAGVLAIAQNEHIPALLIEKEKFFRGNAYVDELKEKHIQFIVLAGFLWKVPALLIRSFHQRIINIHPALLPAYGGKGMYGQHVHEAVLAAGDKESGISIHYVDDLYDHGQLIFQARCPVMKNDNPESLARRIHELEHQHYPVVIEQLIVAGLQHP